MSNENVMSASFIWSTAEIIRHSPLSQLIDYVICPYKDTKHLQQGTVFKESETLIMKISLDSVLKFVPQHDVLTCITLCLKLEWPTFTTSIAVPGKERVNGINIVDAHSNAVRRSKTITLRPQFTAEWDMLQSLIMLIFPLIFDHVDHVDGCDWLTDHNTNIVSPLCFTDRLLAVYMVNVNPKFYSVQQQFEHLPRIWYTTHPRDDTATGPWWYAFVVVMQEYYKEVCTPNIYDSP